MMSKNILIAAGGTGGHIYPALSLARELRKRGYEVFFAVKKDDVSLELLDKERFKYFQLNISGLPRKISPRLILFFFRLIISFFSAIKIINRVKPVTIVGLGGYVSFAPAFAGKLFGIPLIIHEQNMLPGVANRILARVADKIAVSFPDAQKYFKGKVTVFTGNHIREELLGISREQASARLKLDKAVFTVMVFGGSQGAHALNMSLVRAITMLGDYRDKVQFVHISGNKDFELIKKEYEGRGFKSVVAPYMFDIENAYAASDLVICRAGAMTITELVALKKPAIIIPFPFAAENHQEFNADYLGSRNAAIVINEKNLTENILADKLIELVRNPQKIVAMRNAYTNVPFIKNSSEIFADMIFK